jgi:hypothetical protein
MSHPVLTFGSLGVKGEVTVLRPEQSRQERFIYRIHPQQRNAEVFTSSSSFFGR